MDDEAAMTPRRQWRVSWSMQPHGLPRINCVRKIYDDEAGALAHLKGLRWIEAHHEPGRPGGPVWDIQLEVRASSTKPWSHKPEPPR